MIYIIGDVHGCYYALLSLIDKIKSKDKHPSFVFTGDYCDRGKNTKQTIEYLIQFSQKENVNFVRGNHDDVMDYIVNGQAAGHPSEWVVGAPTPEKAMSWFVQHGFDLTMSSYGVGIQTSGPYGQKDYTTAVMDLREAVPESHKRFFSSLPLYWENDTHFVCHGFIDPGIELPRSLKFLKSDKIDEMLWGRFGLVIRCEWDKIGVFGHTPYDSVLKMDKVRLIDTGSFTGNKLTAYCCETDKEIFVKPDERDVDSRYLKK